MKTTKPLPDSDTPIALHIAASRDWVYTIVYGSGLCLFGYEVVLGGSGLPFRRLPEVQPPGVLTDVFNVLGQHRLQVVAAGIAYFCGVSLWAAVWRLYRRAPAILADRSGVTCHPSLHRGRLAWADIVRMSIKPGKTTKLSLQLRHRFWAANCPFTGKAIEMSLMVLGLSHKQAHALLKQMRAWQRQAKTKDILENR